MTVVPGGGALVGSAAAGGMTSSLAGRAGRLGSRCGLSCLSAVVLVLRRTGAGDIAAAAVVREPMSGSVTSGCGGLVSALCFWANTDLGSRCGLLCLPACRVPGATPDRCW